MSLNGNGAGERRLVSLEYLRTVLGGRIEGTPAGPQLRCAGPGHSPKDDSLTITLADNERGYVFYSHAGDPFERVLEYVEGRLGGPAIKVGGKAFAKPNGANGQHATSALGKAVAVYPYHDEGGHKLFEVHRFEPKTFRQKSAAGNWSLAGIRRVLYRLPDVLRSLENQPSVFIVEGEKDVDRLWSVGIPATCNPMGAGKWLDEFADSLMGATVYVIPDEDAPGHKHARQVLASLAKRNIVCGAVRLPFEGGPRPGFKDVSDWLDAGGTPDSLWRLCDGPLQGMPAGAPDAPAANSGPSDGAPPGDEGVPAPLVLRPIDLGAYDGVEIPPQPWAVQDRIPLRNVTLFGGSGGLGKSTLELHRAVAHACGRDWLGMMPEPGPALFFTCEDDAEGIARRLQAIGKHMGVNPFVQKDLHIVSRVGEDALLVECNQRTGVVVPTKLFSALRELVMDVRPVSVSIDASHNVYSGNENDRGQVRQFIGVLHRLAIEGNCSVSLIAHPSRTGLRERTGESGSTAWFNAVRAQAVLQRPEVGEDEEGAERADDGLRELVWRKSQYSAVGETVTLQWRDGLFLPVRNAPDYEQVAKFNRQVNMVFDAVVKLAKRETLAPRNVAARVGELLADEKHPLPRALVRQAIDRLIDEGRISVLEYGPPSTRRNKIVIGSQ